MPSPHPQCGALTLPAVETPQASFSAAFAARPVSGYTFPFSFSQGCRWKGKGDPVKTWRLPLTCPMGHGVCPVLAEMARLREECRQLQELSRTDPLTGLYNWRHLTLELAREMERTRRTGLPTGLIMFDLDHFKRVNDLFGHQFGDAVLRWVCQLVRANIRRLDIPCRYGGEEFAIVLPGTSLERAVKLAERLRRVLSKARLKLEGQTITVTASFGVDVYTASDTLSPAAFLKRTDRYLLAAKAQGRNAVWHRNGQIPAATAVTSDERQRLLTPQETYETTRTSQCNAG